jgi:rhomboid protease GluP
MSDFKKKIRLIYGPFFLGSVGHIVLFTFLHWLLIIKTHTITIKEDVVHFWLPCVLPWLFILLWLRPRIKLLAFQKENKHKDLMYFLAGASIIVPLIFAQNYIASSTGTLTQLKNIYEINDLPKTKYYTVKEYSIDRTHYGIHSVAEVTGKYNEHIDFTNYFTSPLLQKPGDTISFTSAGNTVDFHGTHGVITWVGVKYKEQISNRLSDAQKEEAYKKFYESSCVNYQWQFLNDFQYWKRTGLNDDLDGFLKSCKKCSDRPPTDNPIILEMVHEPFEARNGSNLDWMIITFLGGALIFFGIVVNQPFDTLQLRKFESGEVSVRSDFVKAVSYLVPRPPFPMTVILIEMNILVFLTLVFSGLGFLDFRAMDLLRWGANYRPDTMGGEAWRLVTNIFLHGGIMHLVMNMYGLVFAGLFLEPILGSKKFALAYCLSGIFASLMSIYWYEHTVSVGASGAIFGMYGVLLSLLLTKTHSVKSDHLFLISILIFICYNIVLGLLLSGIDNAAHIGGFVSGFVLGLILAPITSKENSTSHSPIE